MAPRPRAEDAEIPPVLTIRLADADPIDLDGTPPVEQQVPESNPESLQSGDTPTPDRLKQMHQDSAFDFVNPKGWGYVRDRDHVAGFQVHHFRNTPSLGGPARPASAEGSANAGATTAVAKRLDEEWAVRRVELVSLLKHAEPSVYVSKDLPRMDKLSDVPLRPLNTFEQRALRELEAGDEIVNQATTNRVEMLGAIRAAQQCLKCHQVERGELLGAFSYAFERVQPVREKQERELF
jgi:hypothetical protein